MRPTDHVLLLENALYKISDLPVLEELENTLLNICHDAHGLFCAMRIFYLQIICEESNESPFKIDRNFLPKKLANKFMHLKEGLHSLQFHKHDIELDVCYKVTLSGMNILARDHEIEWGIELPPILINA